MEKSDKNDEQMRKKGSIIKLLNIFKNNNKDPNIKKELDTIEERINKEE